MTDGLTYALVNDAINEVFFDGRFAAQPVYLSMDSAMRSEMAARLSASAGTIEDVICDTVRKTLVRSADPFVHHASRARKWHSDGMRTPPPFLAVLYSLAYAAELMEEEGRFASNNYYIRLEQVTDIERELLKRGMKRTEYLWLALNHWLVENNHVLGRPTAFTNGSTWRYVDWPVSQAIVRASDRDRFHDLFERYGFTGSETLSRREMAHYLDSWMRSGHANGRLRKRTLVLTYNTALAADIQRTLALMSIPSDGAGGGISVRTVMSFMYAWLSKLGLTDGGDETFQAYEDRCQEALDYIAAGTISEQEINTALHANPIELGLDAIIVDEAQDWPQVEADLLCRLYEGSKVSLADGIDQLVRGTATNWKASVAGLPRTTGSRHLSEGLRMKASLCNFANAFANEVGLPWHVEPNGKAAGGRIIVTKGNYDDLVEQQKLLLADAITAGNMPIDMLHCVPPSSVEDLDGRRVSRLSRAFVANGWECWDGVDDRQRRNYPRSANMLRVLQYESCRGLEGWTVVLDGFDEFWELKRDQMLSTPVDDGDQHAL